MFDEIAGPDDDGSEIAGIAEPAVKVAAAAPVIDRAVRVERLAALPAADITRPTFAGLSAGAMLTNTGDATVRQLPPSPAATLHDRQFGGAARAMLDLQRAQADLVLASLNDRGARPRLENRQKQNAEPSASAAMSQAAPAHANAPPRGAPSTWFATAMRQTLDKYQASQGLAGAAEPRAW